jgi:hypothetical protein
MMLDQLLDHLIRDGELRLHLCGVAGAPAKVDMEIAAFRTTRSLGSVSKSGRPAVSSSL